MLLAYSTDTLCVGVLCIIFITELHQEENRIFGKPIER